MKVLISNVSNRYLSPKKVANTWLGSAAENLGLNRIPEISDDAHRLAHILSSKGVQDKEVAYGVAWTLQKRYGKSKDPAVLAEAVSKCAGDYSDSIAWGQTEICQKIATDWARIAKSKGSPSPAPGKAEEPEKAVFDGNYAELMEDQEEQEEQPLAEFMPNSIGLLKDFHEMNQREAHPKTTNFEKSAHLAYKIAKGMGEPEESSLCAAIFSAQATLKLESIKDLI